MPTVKRPLFNGNQPLIKGLLSNDIPVQDHDDTWQSPPNTRHQEVTALLDSGATISCIDTHLCDALNLQHFGATSIIPLDDTKSSYRTKFMAKFEFFVTDEKKQKIEIPDFLNAAAMPLNGRPYNVVIGMDVLSKGIFTIHHHNYFEFKF